MNLNICAPNITVSIALAITLAIGASLSQAADSPQVLAFMAGTSKNCSYCDLTKKDLSGRALSGANLSNATLSYANLSNSNLSNASLSHANLYGANLYKATITGANLTGATIYKTIWTNGSICTETTGDSMKCSGSKM